MSEPPFTPAQQEILEQLGKVLGQMFGGLVYMQLRLAALEEVLKEHGQVSDDELEEANERAKARWESGLMIDSLFDRDLHTLLEELRKRMGNAEAS